MSDQRAELDGLGPPYRCRLCWATFDGPGDLAEHEQQEEETIYLIPWEDEPEC